jgi:hypothetical protein
MIVDEFAIPSQKEADRLLAGLSRLIGQRGYETFVCAPILLAEPHYFPDRIEARAPGVVTLLRRLMAYAGLEPKRIELEIAIASNFVQAVRQSRPARRAGVAPSALGSQRPAMFGSAAAATAGTHSRRAPSARLAGSSGKPQRV